MSAIFGYIVESDGTEKEFAASLINYITALSDKITCSTNLDTEYNSSDLTHVPVITFSIDGALTITLTRAYRDGNDNPHEAALSNNSNGFIAACGNISSKVYCISQDSVAYTASIERKFAISSIIDNDLIFLSINGRAYYYATFNNTNLNVIYIKESSTVYTSVYTGVTFAKANIFDFSTRTFKDNTSEVTGTFLSRFAYGCPPGQIDYIKSSVYQNNNSKVFELTSLCDCTTVTTGDTVSLKDGAYLAIGEHQLLKIIDN